MDGAASFCDLAKAARDLDTTTRCIWDMVEEVAKARVIKEMFSERMKQALSKAIVRSGIEAISKAEHAARTDQKYLDEIVEIRADLLVAEKVLQKYAAYLARKEGLRTLISAQKMTIEDIR